MHDYHEIEGSLKDWIEDQVEMVFPERGVIYKNKQGTPYISFCCGGRKEQGLPHKLLASDIVTLETFVKHGISVYLRGLRIEGPRMLYWRMYPKIELISIAESTWYSCILRLVVDKP